MGKVQTRSEASSFWLWTRESGSVVGRGCERRSGGCARESEGKIDRRNERVRNKNTLKLTQNYGCTTNNSPLAQYVGRCVDPRLLVPPPVPVVNLNSCVTEVQIYNVRVAQAVQRFTLQSSADRAKGSSIFCTSIFSLSRNRIKD